MQWFNNTTDDTAMTKPEIRDLLLYMFEDESDDKDR